MGSGASVSLITSTEGSRDPNLPLIMSSDVDESELTRLLSPEARRRVEDAGVITWLINQRAQKNIRADGNNDDGEDVSDCGAVARVTWQELKDAFPELWSNLYVSLLPAGAETVHGGTNRDDASVDKNKDKNDDMASSAGGGQDVMQSAIAESLPPIRVIDFEDFCRETELPRYPERRELCVTLDSIDRASSFLVFISHCWLRGWSGAEGWDGRPHPDNASHEKFKLCVRGIREAWEVWAPGLPRCYVWLDFGCMDQDGNPAGELKQLDEIVRSVDCIFTPVCGVATVPQAVSNYYDDYSLPAWNAPRFGYTSRGWCRVEMFYASNIPYEPSTDRMSRLRHGLQHHASQGRRAHLLFGSREDANGRKPIILPPLQNSYYEKLDPSKGHVTVKADEAKIAELIEGLRPYMRRVEQEYDGEMVDGECHGQGTFRYVSGDVYTGAWERGRKQGYGTYRYADGTVYTGDWHQDKKHGHGVFQYEDGNEYEGMWAEGQKHGEGTFRFIDGALYKGNWVNGKRHGFGIYKDASGDMYEGHWKNGDISGQGTYRFANGDVHEGEFSGGVMHGPGWHRYISGDIYEGGWENGQRSGFGRHQYADGDVYEGDWLGDERHGRGKHQYKDGDNYEGQWAHDALQCHGTYRYSNGDVYEGGWENDKKQGQGVYRYADGDVYEGRWSNGKKHGGGIYRFADGSLYEGDYVNGKRHGNGTYRFTNQNVFSGRFVENKLVEGTLLRADDGKEYRASFEECADKEYNGSRVYLAVLRDALDGSVHREGLFSDGDFIDM